MKLVSLSIFALTVSVSSLGFGQAKASTDPLKAYTKCELPDLKVMDVARRPKSAEKHRDVKTANGAERVSVADGYRVMFSYEDQYYYFANVKIEQSLPADYVQDKERIISSLKHFANSKQATGMIFADKTPRNGFEHYGIDRDQIDVGGQVGTHVLFYDRHHLVITVYLLNQDDRNLFRATAGGPRKFKDIREYRELRDTFLDNYSACLGKIAASQP
jgi:hypothetical protein